MSRPVLAAANPDLALSFVNTRYWRGSPQPTEELATPAQWLDWCIRSTDLPREAVAPITDRWGQDPAAAEAAFDEAIALRETIHRAFTAIAEEAEPAADDLGALNVALARAPARTRLESGEGRHGWSLGALAPGATSLLAPVLWSAGDILAGPARKRLRCCSNEQCRWVFVDDSRGGTRRWCSMSACGNRAKARRHYRRHKATT
jgi:predicted RNA-binding Zn ribbon-like protein